MEQLDIFFMQEAVWLVHNSKLLQLYTFNSSKELSLPLSEPIYDHFKCRSLHVCDQRRLSRMCIRNQLHPILNIARCGQTDRCITTVAISPSDQQDISASNISFAQVVQQLNNVCSSSMADLY